ncbi:MAG: hypothetical protein ACHQT6_09970 [Candidatus Acidiferrales bacterium]
MISPENIQAIEARKLWMWLGMGIAMAHISGGSPDEGEEEEEAGAVAGATKHGSRRMALRNWTPEEITDTKTGVRMTQADGASVFVKGLGHGKYNVVVDGEAGFVTGMKNLTGDEVRALAEKYGWHE